jgi:hypothetical protein
MTADQKALEIGGYHDRGFTPSTYLHKADDARQRMLTDLQGVTLVGANPAFGAAMLTRFLGTAVWHYRLIDVETAGMFVLGWDRPKGLHALGDELSDRGFTIPAPDHTAEGDVRATKAIYEALLGLRSESIAAPVIGRLDAVRDKGITVTVSGGQSDV